MNDTQQAPPGHGPDQDFDPHRLRTITDMKRSKDDRIVGGVCAGAAKYLNIDPVIVRVVIAVLTVAGFAGVILYAAAWVLLPSEDAERSIGADWFNLDKNEEQVRVAGLVAAVVLAVLSLVGDSSWAWWGGAPWWLLPFALLLYVFWIRPRRRREEREQRERHTGAYDPATGAGFDETQHLGVTQQKVSTSRPRRSPALLVLTTSIAAIALAATLIYDQTQENVPWTTYVAVALAVVGVGLLVGTFFGNGGILIGIGILLAIALGIGSVFPSGRIGRQAPTPEVAAQVKATYKHGIGQLELDLSEVSDPERLLGRTIRLDNGIGQTRVIVPDGLNLDVTTDMKGGEIALFGRIDDGTDISMTDTADRPTEPALTIDIDQKLGQIEVINR
ncbi:PspC domain-containing protein [Aeromicrobium stalagmiti]|uniref:PspC domain-containing protein n=1 Tax=Aeromicrobium stalagmiti TaxID=2738988 RepID=UPI001567E081|nr:PspC domain-containing protein [Aeromicrobium stalagmiti]NRQ49798.1 PspC domain-containing protein [Aeromicrobium stalagmiti]